MKTIDDHLKEQGITPEEAAHKYREQLIHCKFTGVNPDKSLEEFKHNLYKKHTLWKQNTKSG